MREYIITTDNNSDLPKAYYQEAGVPCAALSYMMNDVMYDGLNRTQTDQEFYAAVRAGAMPVTQQVNPENSKALFEPYAKQGLDILHLAFSSGLSGTYQSNCIAAEEIREEYPDCNIVVIDTLCASMGQGFLVSEAVKRHKDGMSMQDLIAWVEANKLNIVHEVLADDLFHLQRGGRISKAAAVFGSALNVKPLIQVNNEGKLVSFGKQRGRNAGIAFLANNLAKKIDVKQCERVCISHSDCIEDVEKLMDLVREKTSVTDFTVSYIGPTIGAHTGAGTIALFYFAANRDA
ncbi:MAG: DegV family protein [Faecalibacterium sp.]